jgi:hypothetical protein
MSVRSVGKCLRLGRLAHEGYDGDPIKNRGSYPAVLVPCDGFSIAVDRDFLCFAQPAAM